MPRPCVGLRVRHYRELGHLTQAQLAHAVGCSRVAITQFEAGTSTPSLEVFVRLKHALQAPSLDALLVPCPCHPGPAPGREPGPPPARAS
jgi:DNA-binding XRE family transcriptional regulator